jgi:hypothetical protein
MKGCEPAVSGLRYPFRKTDRGIRSGTSFLRKTVPLSPGHNFRVEATQALFVSQGKADSCNTIEAFKLALQSLWANKLRSILTLLGVIIGVASVIMVVTLTNGAKAFVTEKLNNYGAAVITVSKMPQTFITTDEYLSYQKRKDITYDDYRAILSDANPASRWRRRATSPARSSTDPVHHRHQHSRLDLDDAANDESQYRERALLH